MTDARQRWAQAKELFHAALAWAPDERAARLQEACGEDAALRDEVTSLLEAHAEAGSFAEGAAIDAAAGSPGGALVEGVELGPYRVLGPLDAGGMGEVYRALDTRLQREVAIKVLPASVAADPERVARLAREARLLAALNHPHIATIHGLEITGSLHAIVMELIEGPTLADRLTGGPLAVDAALDVARQIAGALEAAHEKGIIHRDLKPANVKLTAAGIVKVLDFGLAKTAGSPTDGRAVAIGQDGAGSHDGLVAGTLGYMSPEQARGEGVDARSDIWAFGCVVYEMLTAQPAFLRIAAADPGTALLDPGTAALDRGPDWDRLPPAVPPGIRRMLRRCLERDPARRLHHIADARLEIEDAANDAERLDLAHATKASRRRARAFGAATIALALALAATLGAWLWRRAPDAPELRVAEITIRHPSPCRPMGGVLRSSPITTARQRCGYASSTPRTPGPCQAPNGRVGPSGRPTAARSAFSGTAS
jgi:serine/threonine protein kinase